MNIYTTNFSKKLFKDAHNVSTEEKVIRVISVVDSKTGHRSFARYSLEEFKEIIGDFLKKWRNFHDLS